MGSIYIWPFTKSPVDVCVCVQDQGEAPLRDSVTLTVATTDANDLDPVFEPPSYSKSIYENTTEVRSDLLFTSLTT